MDEKKEENEKDFDYDFDVKDGRIFINLEISATSLIDKLAKIIPGDTPVEKWVISALKKVVE